MKSIFEAVLLVYLIHFLKGDLYCSKNVTVIDCLPCSSICEKKNATCTNNNLYACPRNCDNKKCNDVCCPSCRNDECELRDNGQVKCTEGCVPGTTGMCCLEPCPIECRECDQFNVSCTSCHEGMTGQYCNESVGVFTQPTSCPPQNTTCRDILPTTSPSQVAEIAHILPLIAGLGCVIFLVICILVCFKLTRIYQVQCSCKKRPAEPNTSQSSEQSLSTEHGYNYIDENDLDPYYSHLKQQTRAARFPVNDIYNGIGQNNPIKAKEETNSFYSSSSGSMFGNLFDTSVEGEIIQMNILQNNDINNVSVSVYEYDKYITPTSS